MQQKPDTIQTTRVKFSQATYQGRYEDVTKDQKLVNLFPETVEQLNYDQPRRVLLVKRPGLTVYTTQTAGEGRGIFGWNGHIYYVIGNILYKDTTNTGTTLATTTGQVGFTECTLSGAHALFFCDGTDGYVINGAGTITKITDIDFPTPHVPTPVYTDGYVALLKNSNGTADVYTCDLNNPLSWTAGNFLTAEELPDGGICLARQNNYIVVFGANSTEFFYVDPNNVTGTPLARNSGAFLQIGAASPYSIGQQERYCFFIGQSGSGGRTVWQLDGFTPTQIGTDSIDKVLDNEQGNVLASTGYLLRLAGHFFYVLILSNSTFVYDIDEKTWHEWTSPPSRFITLTQINGAPINSYVINAVSSSTLNTNTQFLWKYACDIGNGVVYLLNASNGFISVFDINSYQDIDQPITCEYTTPNQDFNSFKRKNQYRLSIIGDIVEGTGSVYWSDDDYNTWSSAKTVDFSLRPVIHRGGQFRRRAYKIKHTDNTPLRIEALEIMLSEGNT